jgi:hypothetical protein
MSTIVIPLLLARKVMAERGYQMTIQDVREHLEEDLQQHRKSDPKRTEICCQVLGYDFFNREAFQLEDYWISPGHREPTDMPLELPRLEFLEEKHYAARSATTLIEKITRGSPTVGINIHHGNGVPSTRFLNDLQLSEF